MILENFFTYSENQNSKGIEIHTIRELENADSNLPEEYRHNLVTDSQDIQSILDHISRSGGKEEYGLLFVQNIEGEINSVYAHFQNVPYLHYQLEKLL